MTSPALRSSGARRALPSTLVCAGCGYRAPAGELPLRCPNARQGDDVDHVMRRVLDPNRVEWPAGGEANPFIRYRTLFHWYHLARAAGRSDSEIVDEIARLDERVATVDGRGFLVTPFERAARLGEAAGFADEGGVWVKDETGNVSGTHKARHLFGTLLALNLTGAPRDRPLAIASCGNAALAAAVVARADGRELHVFVPIEADPLIVDRLEELGAKVSICERSHGESGDPSFLRMREAVARGAVPFTCQGSQNGLAIEGGLTLGYEIADSMREQQLTLEHLVIQVGGGALASSVIQALGEARQLGVIERLPLAYAVQTAGVAPLVRAYRLVRDELSQGRAATDVLREATRRRSRYMRPWWPVRQSLATGILDDETYDWLEIVRGMLATGGRPLMVDEPALRQANRVALETTDIDVDPTGSAGLAGLLQLRDTAEIGRDETSAVLFTGVNRTGGTP